jgi:hypothetical protein
MPKPSPNSKRGKVNKPGLPPPWWAGVAERPKAADSRSALVGVPRFESWPRHKKIRSRSPSGFPVASQLWSCHRLRANPFVSATVAPARDRSLAMRDVREEMRLAERARFKRHASDGFGMK